MKVFCIGLAKSGTTSMHMALEMLGLRSIHHGEGFGPHLTQAELTAHLESARTFRIRVQENVANGRAPLDGLPVYDAYLDIAPLTRYFRDLDRAYPGSKFIWTERDDRDWALSRIKHAIRETRRRLLHDATPGALDDLDPDVLIEKKARLLAAIRGYFASRPADLLIINVCAGEGFEKLCPFLGLPAPPEAFPWANRARK